MLRAMSQVAFTRAKQLIPGGVNSPARAFGAVGGNPVFFERAQGAYLHDVDGNRYLDYVGSWGPMILGHRHSAVVEAVQAALDRGTSFGAPTTAETELAQLITQAVPSVEKVRLVNSGTEAAASAIRLARGYTGRERIAKFAGNYHGHVDSLLVSAGSSAATLSVPDSPGVTPGTSGDTLVLRYNDTEQLVQVFGEQGDRIAAVICEPVAGNMGCVPGTPEFLTMLRQLTMHYGALLIFDEVMSGFRVAYGGAQERLGITPDLTTLGKIIGGGLPVGAYGGRAEIMDHVLPVGRVFQAGTLSGNPLATAAGIATLGVLRDTNPYGRLEDLSQQLADGLSQIATRVNVPHTIGRCGSMMTLFFNGQKVVDWDSARGCDTKRFAAYFWGLLDRAIYMPCSQFETFFISTAHTEAHIEETISAARDVLAAMGR